MMRLWSLNAILDRGAWERYFAPWELLESNVSFLEMSCLNLRRRVSTGL